MTVERSSRDADATGPGWYVIERPNRDPARVIRGPLDYEDADHAARAHTTQARVTQTPALVYSIKYEGYNVEWYERAEKPRSLRPEAGHEEGSA